VIRFSILSVYIDLNKERIFIDEIDSVKDAFGFVPLEEIPCSMNLAYEDLESDIVDTLSRVVGTTWSEHGHQSISLLILHLD
jgi:hypothetical protein